MRPSPSSLFPPALQNQMSSRMSGTTAVGGMVGNDDVSPSSSLDSNPLSPPEGHFTSSGSGNIRGAPGQSYFLPPRPAALPLQQQQPYLPQTANSNASSRNSSASSLHNINVTPLAYAYSEDSSEGSSGGPYTPITPIGSSSFNTHQNYQQYQQRQQYQQQNSSLGLIDPSMQGIPDSNAYDTSRRQSCPPDFIDSFQSFQPYLVGSGTSGLQSPPAVLSGPDYMQFQKGYYPTTQGHLPLHQNNSSININISNNVLLPAQQQQQQQQQQYQQQLQQQRRHSVASPVGNLPSARASQYHPGYPTLPSYPTQQQQQQHLMQSPQISLANDQQSINGFVSLNNNYTSPTLHTSNTSPRTANYLNAGRRSSTSLLDPIAESTTAYPPLPELSENPKEDDDVGLVAGALAGVDSTSLNGAVKSSTSPDIKQQQPSIGLAVHRSPGGSAVNLTRRGSLVNIGSGTVARKTRSPSNLYSPYPVNASATREYTTAGGLLSYDGSLQGGNGSLGWTKKEE